jgi:hypothetical protein
VHPGFFNTHFGQPLYMKPNYDNLSCEMVFGQHPPPARDDPALTQPCLHDCDISGDATAASAPCFRLPAADALQ